MSYLLGKVFSKSEKKKDEFEDVKETYGQKKRRLRNNISNICSSVLSGKKLAESTFNSELMDNLESAHNWTLYRNYLATPEEQDAIDSQGIIGNLYDNAEKSSKLRSRLGLASGLAYGLGTTYFKNKREKKRNLKQNKERLKNEFGSYDRYYSDLAYEGVITTPEDDEVFRDEPEDKNVKKRTLASLAGFAGLYGILNHLDNKSSGVKSKPLLSDKTKGYLLGSLGVASLLGAGKLGYDQYKAHKSRKEQEAVRSGIEDAFRRRAGEPTVQNNNPSQEEVIEEQRLPEQLDSVMSGGSAAGYRLNRSGNHRGMVRGRRKVARVDNRDEELEDIRTVHRRRVVRPDNEPPIRRKRNPRGRRIPQKPIGREENLAERQRRIRAERKESSYRSKLPPSTESILTRRLLKGEELLKGDNIVFNNKKKYLKVYV